MKCGSPARGRRVSNPVVVFVVFLVALLTTVARAQTFSGLWDVTELADGSACGFGNNTYQFPMLVRQHGQVIALYEPGKTSPYTLGFFSGNRVRTTDSFTVEDGWQVSSVLELQFSGASMNGTLTGTYTKGAQSCVDRSTYTGVRRGAAGATLTTPVLSLTQTGNTVTAQWSLVSGATSYTLYYAPYPAGAPLTAVHMGSARSISQTLPAGAAFYAAVGANADASTSSLSNLQMFTAGKPAPGNPASAAVATLSVSQQSLYLKPGQTRELTITLRDASNTSLSGRTVQWSSSNSAVATVVSVTGGARVTGVGIGSATLTATSEGKSTTVSVNVVATLANSITVNPSVVSLNAQQQQQLTAVVKDAAGNAVTDTVSWTSSNNVATVSSNGLVTGIAAGTAQITARSSEGVTASITVTVKAGSETYELLQSLTLYPEYYPFISWSPNQAVEIRAEGKLTNGSTLTSQYAEGLIWSSSNPAVATITKGTLDKATLRLLQKGTTTITVKLGSKTAQMVVGVGVDPTPLQSLTFSLGAGSLTVGSCGIANAQIVNIYGVTPITYDPGYTVIWSSSNPAVFTTENNGQLSVRVCGVSAGTATLTGTAGGKTWSIPVSVGGAGSFQGFMTAPEEVDVLLGQDLALSFGVKTDDLSWYSRGKLVLNSANPAVATVTGPGTVPATGFYTATVSGRAVGSTTLTFTADSLVETVRVNVLSQPRVRRIQVSPVIVNNFQVGMSDKPKVYLYDWQNKPLSATGRTITWESSKPGVASVDASGTVTALQIGEALITAKTDGVSSDPVWYQVVPTLGSIQVTPSPSTIAVGADVVLTAKLLSQTGVEITGRTISWSSSNKNVASVSNGRVTGISSGTVTITASTGGVSGTATVVVGSGGASGGGGSGGGGGGSTTPVVGSNSIAIPLDSLNRGEETSWRTVSNLCSTLEFMVRLGSLNAGSAQNPSYQYNLYIRNKGSKRIAVSWSYRLGGAAPTTTGFRDDLDPGEQTSDYWFGAPGIEPIWIYLVGSCN